MIVTLRRRQPGWSQLWRRCWLRFCLSLQRGTTWEPGELCQAFKRTGRPLLRLEVFPRAGGTLADAGTVFPNLADDNAVIPTNRLLPVGVAVLRGGAEGAVLDTAHLLADQVDLRLLVQRVEDAQL